MYRLGIDFLESFQFSPDDLPSWPVLILESDEVVKEFLDQQ